MLLVKQKAVASVVRLGGAIVAAAGGMVTAHPVLAQSPAPNDFSQRASPFLVSARTEPVRRFNVAPDGTITFTTPDPGKYLWNQLFALLAADPSGNSRLPGTTPAVSVRQMIHALFTFPDLFHFNADGPAACLMQYPALVLPEDRRYFFEGHSRSLLARTEGINYNLFTGEGTENHLAMSRFAAYLLCQNWLSDHPGDVRAQTGLEQARQYLLSRAAMVPNVGTGEWNSSTYYGYALRGPLLCRTWARDPVVKKAAETLLDSYAADMALGYFNGISARPESRGTPHGSADAERDQIAYLWWGDSPLLPHGATNAVWAALSSYRPPASLAAIANKTAIGDTGRTFYNSHPSYLLNVPAECRETLYLGPGGQYAVSCAYLPYAGYTGATAQFIPMKIVARSSAANQSAQTVIGNDNSRGDNGVGRGPYTQWAQYKSTVFQLTFLPADAPARAKNADAITAEWHRRWQTSFRRRFHSKGDEESSHGPTASVVRTEQITSFLLLPEGAVAVAAPSDAAGEDTGRVFVRLGDSTYLAVQTLSGAAPTLDKGRLSVPVFPETLNGFVIEAGGEREWKTFAAFQNGVRARTHLNRKNRAATGTVSYTNLSGNQITVQYAFSAHAPLTEPIYDWGYLPSAGAADVPQPIPTMPPFIQPVYFNAPASKTNRLTGWGRIPMVTVDDKPLSGDWDFLDVSRFWPLVKEDKTK